MSRTRTLAALVSGAVATAGLAIVAGGGPAAATPTPASTVLPGSAVPFASHAAAGGAVPAGQRLTVQVWLRPRLAAAERFASAVSTPGNASFRHFLRPDVYGARFGAAAGTVAQVRSWLRSAGFTGLSTGPEHAYIRATGTAGTINAAFRTELEQYPATAAASAGRYRLRANDGPVSVPAALAGRVLGVTGLDNAAPIIPLDRPNGAVLGHAAPRARSAAASRAPCSHYYGEHVLSGLPAQFGTTSFPTEVCGYSASQLRSAYGASAAATGTGQTIALVELGLTRDMFRTLQDYARGNRLPRPAGRRYRELPLGRDSACGDPFDGEEQLDVEAAYAMAPGATQLVVGGDSCNQGDFGLQGLFDADLAVLGGTGGHPLATVASNSWESGDEAQPASLTGVEHAFLVQAAAEGVGMYFSSGDGSGVAAPSSDPYAIAVGGTTLGIGRGHRRLFETGWSTGVSVLLGRHWMFEGEQGAAGGGPSLLWAQPGFQAGVVPDALAQAPGDRGGLVRSAPDISADADPFTGFALGALAFHRHRRPTYTVSDIGGTSLAAPLVAGMVTAAQQGQPAPFGFLDPALYQIYQGSSGALHDPLALSGSSPAAYRGIACPAATCGSAVLATFDDQNRNMFGYTGQVTLSGYDNMTGTGTPAGPAFLAALRSAG
ncbi:MAG TPA: protease pro-enzyme activation domain-containing protein [Streptosporangiaceae bacterium]|nr:protease pro-enzyme activation domain-containing protein [Streptosporangiaceae bacterium]